MEARQGPEIEQEQHEGQGYEHRLGEQSQRQAQPYQQRAGERVTPSMLPAVREQREHPEKAAENVFALRGPRHRFDVERVHREHGGHEGTGPERPGEQREGVEGDHARWGVENDVGGMHARSTQAVDRVVEGEGSRSQGVPIRESWGCEMPQKLAEGHIGAQARIVDDVRVVVVVNELVASHLQIHRGGEDQQHQADKCVARH